MERLMLGLMAFALALVMAASFAETQAAAPQRTVTVDAKGNPVTDPMLDPFRAYYTNTYTCYWPGAWECHHWWNEDGSEQFFQVNWMPEGMIMLKVSDGGHDSFIANGQWCSHNAKTAATAGNAASKELRGEETVRDKAPDPNEVNNNKNGCSPVVDATPGDHWYKLHLNGHLQDQREQYTLMPGHQ